MRAGRRRADIQAVNKEYPWTGPGSRASRLTAAAPASWGASSQQEETAE